MPNLLTKLSIAIDQIEIKYLEEQIHKNPDSQELINKIKKVRKDFENIAKYAGLAD